MAYVTRETFNCYCNLILLSIKESPSRRATNADLFFHITVWDPLKNTFAYPDWLPVLINGKFVWDFSIKQRMTKKHKNAL